MKYFGTYFDKNYLTRGIALYNSLNANVQDFTLFVLCLDDFTYDYFNANEKFKFIIPVRLVELEKEDTDFLECKNNRSKIEYYFTLSPVLPLYLLKKYNLDHICTLDADVLVLSSIHELLDSFEPYSIVITPHKFSKENIHCIKYGKFNVSFQYFKNNKIGLNCLEKWRSECINWCYDILDEGENRFADQKYLDRWPNIYGNNLLILDNDTCGLAVWNVNNYVLTYINGVYYSNGQKIVFYHFHNFKILGKSIAINGFEIFNVIKNNTLNKLYFQYWNELCKDSNLIHLTYNKNMRTHYKSDIHDLLSDSKSIYFKLFKKKLLLINFNKMPVVIQNIIINLNGRTY